MDSEGVVLAENALWVSFSQRKIFHKQASESDGETSSGNRHDWCDFFEWTRLSVSGPFGVSAASASVDIATASPSPSIANDSPESVTWPGESECKSGSPAGSTDIRQSLCCRSAGIRSQHDRRFFRRCDELEQHAYGACCRFHFRPFRCHYGDPDYEAADVQCRRRCLQFIEQQSRHRCELRIQRPATR